MTSTECGTSYLNTAERLIRKKTLRDGRVVAVNIWRTGFQELVYPNLDSFEAAKIAVEQEGAIPEPVGFAEI